MAETPRVLSLEELQAPDKVSSLRSETIKNIESYSPGQEVGAATVTKGKRREDVRTNRADHKMLPPEILETYGSSPTTFSRKIC